MAACQVFARLASACMPVCAAHFSGALPPPTRPSRARMACWSLEGVGSCFLKVLQHTAALALSQGAVACE
eukprot:13310327-Alexandrium_andersonii.AAC.1